MMIRPKNTKVTHTKSPKILSNHHINIIGQFKELHVIIQLRVMDRSDRYLQYLCCKTIL